MNCFQIIIFVLTRTAISILVYMNRLLWIAFKSLSLCWQEQHICKKLIDGSVVNCFQIIIFVLTRTASYVGVFGDEGCELLSNHYLCADKNSQVIQKWNLFMLWIAFKSLSLCWQEQPFMSFSNFVISCELLSNHYLCADKNSSFRKRRELS